MVNNEQHLMLSEITSRWVKEQAGFVCHIFFRVFYLALILDIWKKYFWKISTADAEGVEKLKESSFSGGKGISYKVSWPGQYKGKKSGSTVVVEAACDYILWYFAPSLSMIEHLKWMALCMKLVASASKIYGF
jgi:hypothetical protein